MRDLTSFFIDYGLGYCEEAVETRVGDAAHDADLLVHARIAIVLAAQVRNF